jgi:hypothetical protein
MKKHSIWKKHATYIAIIFLAGLFIVWLSAARSNQTPELTFAAMGMVVAVGIPMYQRVAERDDAKETQQRFAMAFGVILLPKLRTLVEQLDLELRENRNNRIQQPVDQNRFVLYQTGDRWLIEQWFAEQWQAVAQCDTRVVTQIVAGLSYLDAASERVDKEYAETIEELDGERYGEITFFDRNVAEDYLNDLNSAATHLRNVIRAIGAPAVP